MSKIQYITPITQTQANQFTLKKQLWSLNWHKQMRRFVKNVLSVKVLIFIYQQQWPVPSSAPWWLDTGAHQECLNTLNHSSAPPPSSGVCCAGLQTLYTHTHTHTSRRINKCARRGKKTSHKILCALSKIETTGASNWTNFLKYIY